MKFFSGSRAENSGVFLGGSYQAHPFFPGITFIWANYSDPAEVTLNGGLVTESLQKCPKLSGLVIIGKFAEIYRLQEIFPKNPDP